MPWTREAVVGLLIRVRKQMDVGVTDRASVLEGIRSRVPMHRFARGIILCVTASCSAGIDLHPIVALIVARYCDPDANVQSGERFAEQSMLNTPLPTIVDRLHRWLILTNGELEPHASTAPKPRVLRGERLFGQEGYATGGFNESAL